MFKHVLLTSGYEPFFQVMEENCMSDSLCLTCLTVAFPRVPVLSVSVGVSVVVGHGHVLQAVLLWAGGIRVGQAIGWVSGQAIGRSMGCNAATWAEALTRADCTWPLGNVLSVQSVPFASSLFGPAQRQ